MLTLIIIYPAFTEFINTISTTCHLKEILFPLEIRHFNVDEDTPLIIARKPKTIGVVAPVCESRQI